MQRADTIHDYFVGTFSAGAFKRNKPRNLMALTCFICFLAERYALNKILILGEIVNTNRYPFCSIFSYLSQFSLIVYLSLMLIYIITYKIYTKSY